MVSSRRSAVTETVGRNGRVVVLTECWGERRVTARIATPTRATQYSRMRLVDEFDLLGGAIRQWRVMRAQTENNAQAQSRAKAYCQTRQRIGPRLWRKPSR